MRATTAVKSPTTLCVDVGGTGLKIMLLDAGGKPLSSRLRAPTPEKPTPTRVMAVLNELRKQVASFDRVSVGFPGVVKRGATYTAANLHPKWVGFNLQKEIEKTWGKPARVANDAAVQGFAAIQSVGVEMILTLGTGLGSAIYTQGWLCPGLELGHHPWRKHTYEDYLGRRGYQKFGRKKWNKLLEKAIEQTRHTFNWDHLYLGGGNAKEIQLNLTPDITIVSNEDGLLGGAALWRHET